MAEPATFVVVGASLAGASAVGALREAGFDGRIVLAGEEAELPYERPPLSKGYLLGKAERDSVFVHPREWYDEQRVELRLGTAVTALDVRAHEVELTGGERLRYDRALLATGSVVRPLDVPGGATHGVRYLRRLADSERLREDLAPGRRVVVVGAGWIGLEVAAAASLAEARVTVVEMAGLPLQRVLGDEVGAAFRDLHAAHGVEFRFGTGVREVHAEGGKVAGVVTHAGEELPADLVVAGVGIRPATDLAEAAGLAVDDGVLVDASLRTSDPDVFAAGDVARAEHPFYGRSLRVEHWANALNQAPAAARAMLGQQVSYDRLPYFFSDQYDLGMEYAGWADPRESTVVLRGDVAGLAFQAFWLDDRQRVAAGMHANLWDEGLDPVKDLISSRRPVDPARLADASVPLADVAERRGR